MNKKAESMATDLILAYLDELENSDLLDYLPKTITLSEYEETVKSMNKKLAEIRENLKKDN